MSSITVFSQGGGERRVRKTITNVHNTDNNVLDLMNYMTGPLSFEPSEPSVIKSESLKINVSNSYLCL